MSTAAACNPALNAMQVNKLVEYNIVVTIRKQFCPKNFLKIFKFENFYTLSNIQYNRERTFMNLYYLIEAQEHSPSTKKKQREYIMDSHIYPITVKMFIETQAL